VYAGGVYAAWYTTANIDDSSFVGNAATTTGGAIYLVVDTTVNLRRNQLCGNTAVYSAGVLDYANTTVLVAKNRIDNHVASGAAGGVEVYFDGTTPTGAPVLRNNV